MACTARRKGSRRWAGRFWKVGRAVGSITNYNNKDFLYRNSGREIVVVSHNLKYTYNAMYLRTKFVWESTEYIAWHVVAWWVFEMGVPEPSRVLICGRAAQWAS